MIEGYIGRPGSGKSYTLTKRAIDEAERGRTVFANYPINWRNCFTFRPEDLLDLPPGVIVIDEAHLWFPARLSLKLPPSWLAMLSQTRKNGWDLLWCAQHEARVDRVIRDVSSWLWLCSSWWPRANGAPMLFKAELYEPEQFRKPRYRQAVKWARFRRKIAEAYDTFERIRTAQHVDKIADDYADRSVKERERRAITAGAAS